ncbi:MAG: hypothetical protein J6K05_05375 [Bacteroidaceae bacterium]|nr:hypothetical protein [Bacteroidaceae bacterium]
MTRITQINYNLYLAFSDGSWRWLWQMAMADGYGSWRWLMALNFEL